MNEIFYISTLIIKKKLKTLSDSEKLRLDEYYKRYPFSRDINFEDVVKKISEYSIINKEEAWEAILNKTEKPKNTLFFSLVKKTWFKYSVAASIALLISLPFFLNKFNTTESLQLEPPVIIGTSNDNIKKGKGNATLTLEDGSIIVLEKGKEYIDNNIESNGEKIIYNKVDNTKLNDKPITYNYLTIPRGGQFFIVLEDSTRVWLNSESKLKYPTSFIKGKERIVELVYGEAYFDVSSSTSHNGSSFSVFAEGQKINFLGTEFNVKAYQDENYVYTTLVEGKVVVGNGVQKKVLNPHEQSILNKENKGIIITEVDVFNEISWKNGLFSFKSKSLKDIMVVLSRWYDVDVLFLNKSLEAVNFKGVLSKTHKIESFLSNLEQQKYINAYDINGKTILIK